MNAYSNIPMLDLDDSDLDTVAGGFVMGDGSVRFVADPMASNGAKPPSIFDWYGDD